MISFRESIEDERKKKRRQEREAKKRTDKVSSVLEPAPMVELVRLPYQNSRSFINDQSSNDEETSPNVFPEDTLAHELEIEMVNSQAFQAPPRRKQLSGEEYFETDPTESEFNQDTTNRVFDTGHNDYSIDQAYDTNYRMIAADSVEFDLAHGPVHAFKSEKTKKDLETETSKKMDYKRQLYEMKERLQHFERMKGEYEKLYTEFLVKSIKA